MTEAVLAEARRYLEEAARQACERGQHFPTSGARFEKAVRTAASCSINCTVPPGSQN